MSARHHRSIVRPARRLRHLWRRPLSRRLATLAVVGASAVVSSASLQRAADAERAWGSAVEVVVATRLVPAGSPLEHDDVAIVRWPAGLVPPDALTEAPIGRNATVALHPGEAIVAGRVAPAGTSPLASLLVGEGWRAMAVPRVDDGLTLEPGDRVDILATFSTDGAEAGPPTFPVASDAEVLAVAPTSVTVAVRTDDASRLAFATTTGVVTLALRAG